jgi:cell division septation protein DedD
MTERMLLSCIAVFALFSFPVAAAATAPVMLQIGAFPTQAEADAVSARFKQAHAATLAGAGSEVRRADLGTRGIWYRVLIGPFADRPAANRICTQLKAEGGSCFAASGEPQAAAADLPPWIVAPPGGTPSSTGAPSKAPAPPANLRPSAAPSTAARTTPAAGQTDLARVLNLAEEGDAQAQLQLGGFYRTGRGVARDDQAAIRWYRAAAEKGLAEAQFELGKVYDTGTGGPRDPFEAVRWYRLAAQQGLGRAQYNLGSMHGNGEGVPVDYVKAYVWFSISEATLTGAERETARNAKGQAVQLMNPDDLARAIRLAQRCLTSAYQNCD